MDLKNELSGRTERDGWRRGDMWMEDQFLELVRFFWILANLRTKVYIPFQKSFQNFTSHKSKLNQVLLLRVTTVLIDFFFDRGGERSFLRCLSSWKKRGGREEEEKEVNFRAIHAKNAALARVQTRRAFYSRA